jgi:outer membrane protein TolC
VGSSIEPDLARVDEITDVAALPALPRGEVDPDLDDGVRALLDQPLDAETAVRIAILGNRELRARLREVGIARGELIQAGVLPNPLVEIESLPERNTSIEVRAEYHVTSLILAPRRAHAARAALDASRVEAAGAVIALAYEARAAFYALEGAEQRLGVARLALETLAAERDAAVALAEAGNLPAVRTAGAIAAFERARITVSEIDLEAFEARERVQRLLGLDGEAIGWRLGEELAPAPELLVVPEDLEARAIASSLELRETRHRLEAIARRVGVARTEGWLPDVDVDVHVLRGNPDDSAATGPSALRVGAGVSIGVPLFDRQQGTVRAYQAALDALGERYRGIAIDVQSAARQARNRVRSLHARVRQLHDVVRPAQAQILEQTLLQYNAMQIGVFELLRARREALDVELAYVDTLRDYWIASAALDALLAGGRIEAPVVASGRMSSAGDASAGGH